MLVDGRFQNTLPPLPPLHSKEIFCPSVLIPVPLSVSMPAPDLCQTQPPRLFQPGVSYRNGNANLVSSKCCCCALRSWTKLFAGCQIGIGLFFTILVVIFAAYDLLINNIMPYMQIALILCLIYLILGCILRKGAQRESRPFLCTWIVLEGIIVLVIAVNGVIVIIVNLSYPNNDVIPIVFLLFGTGGVLLIFRHCAVIRYSKYLRQHLKLIKIQHPTVTFQSVAVEDRDT